MSKFCENCGSELKETDTTCPNCGAAVEKTTKKDVEVNNTNTTANTTTSNTATNEVKEKKNNTKLFAIIGGIAAAVILVIIIIALACSGGYKKPIDYMFTGMEKASSKTFLKAFPKVMQDKFDDEAMDDLKESLEKEYGDKIKITYKILDKEKIDKDDLEEIQDALEKKYDDAKKGETKVTAGYKLTVKATIKGKDDKDSNSTTINVYKIGGKWCLSSPSSMF